MPEQEVGTPDSLVSRIKSRVQDSISMTSSWETNQKKWHKMRMRIKKAKTFPFIGCANLKMPTIEIKLRKVKAALVNSVFGIRPVVQVVPSPSGNWSSAIKIEKFLDHLINDVIKLKDKSIITIDQMLEKGFYLLKPYWKIDIITRDETLSLDDLSVEEAMWIFGAERTDEELVTAIGQRYDVDMNDLVAKENGEELVRIIEALKTGKNDIKVSFKDVIYDAPDVSLCEPERIYVPTDSGYNPQECSYVIHEFMLPLETIRMNGEVKGWDLGEILDIEDSVERARDKDIDTIKEDREGISVLGRTGKVRIWEYYGYEKIKGKNQKCVITIAPDFNKTLRKLSLPFYSGKYPFVKFFYELTDDRWFAHRGIPEIIEDIVKEIDLQHCQKIDQQTMRNVPQYAFRAGMLNPNAVQFLFGQGYPVQGMQPLSDLIMPINNNNPNVEFSYEREQMILESKVEELVGQVDFTLQSMINKRQPRTLGEVQLQQQNMQQVFSLDADVVRMQFEEVFKWIWELWCQYGKDDYEFAYFGKEGWEPIKLTKEETQGSYKVTVRGNDQNTNSQVRLQKAQMILMSMENQFAIQSGVVTPMNLANAYKRLFQELDIPNWEELVSPPQPPQPQPPDVKIKMDDLTDGEQAQVLASRGIQPDSQGRALKSKSKLDDKESDRDMKGAEVMTKIMKTIGGNEPKEPKDPNVGGY